MNWKTVMMIKNKINMRFRDHRSIYLIHMNICYFVRRIRKLKLWMNVIQFWTMSIWRISLCIKKGHLKIKYTQRTICTIVISEEVTLYAKSITRSKRRSTCLCVEEEWRNSMIYSLSIWKLIGNWLTKTKNLEEEYFNN